MKKHILICIIVCVFALAGCSEPPEQPVGAPPSETSYINALEPSAPPADTPALTTAVPSPSPTPAQTKAPAPTPAAPSASPEAAPEPSSNAHISEMVRISITGMDDNLNILPPTDVEITHGDTVFDVLLKITERLGIPLEYSGSKKTVYVKSINGLSEFDKGGMSGWMYKVGGEIPSKSCGAYAVSSSDVIEFYYTTTLGRAE